MIVVLSIGCLATLRAINYLLGAILNVPAQVGIPLIPVIATIAWSVPLIAVRSLRDIGTFRLPLSWSVLLLLPIVVLNWVFSLYFAIPMLLPWLAWKSGYGVATGVFEELVCRGYAFRRVPETHPRLVVLASAFCFALVHLPWLAERPLAAVLQQMVFAAVVGTALGIIRMISGSLGWCMLLHGAINAAQPADVPGLKQYTPYVMILVAIASILTLCRHSIFRARLPARRAL